MIFKTLHIRRDLNTPQVIFLKTKIPKFPDGVIIPDTQVEQPETQPIQDDDATVAAETQAALQHARQTMQNSRPSGDRDQSLLTPIAQVTDAGSSMQDGNRPLTTGATPKLGFHEQQGRAWNGKCWSIGWAEAADESNLNAATALFPDGSSMVCESVLVADLTAKGVIARAPKATSDAAGGRNQLNVKANGKMWESIQLLTLECYT